MHSAANDLGKSLGRFAMQSSKSSATADDTVTAVNLSFSLNSLPEEEEARIDNDVHSDDGWVIIWSSNDDGGIVEEFHSGFGSWSLTTSSLDDRSTQPNDSATVSSGGEDEVVGVADDGIHELAHPSEFLCFVGAVVYEVIPDNEDNEDFETSPATDTTQPQDSMKPKQPIQNGPIA